MNIAKSERNETMWSQIHNARDVKSETAEFPDGKGTPSMQVLNADSAIGPAMLRIMMQPGDEIPRHYHAAQAETLYILEGELIDEGKTAYSAGTELNVKPNIHHGPHTTKTGVTFLAMYTGKVDLTDFKLSKGAE